MDVTPRPGRGMEPRGCQCVPPSVGDSQGPGRSPGTAGLGSLQQGERVEPRVASAVPVPLNTDVSSRTSTRGLLGARGSSVGHQSISRSLQGPSVLGQSTGTPGPPPGSSQGRWKLTSPGRQQCLASHSGLVHLNVHLVTKLITHVPSPARLGCPLASALLRLPRHVWNHSLLDSSCSAAPGCAPWAGVGEGLRAGCLLLPPSGGRLRAAVCLCGAGWSA